MYTKRQFNRDRVLAFMSLVIFIVASCMLNDFERRVNASPEVTIVSESDFQAVDDKVCYRYVESLKTDLKKPKTMWVTVTAYCDCKVCCGKWSGTKKMKVGQIAASRSIPFGTRVKINGKVYIVNDRLAKKYDKRMDIYFKTHAEALKFGKKHLKVEVLP